MTQESGSIMYCVHCGKPIIPNTKFCGGCGRSIETNQPSELAVPVKRPEASTSSVSVGERLLATVGLIALFAVLLLIATRYVREAMGLEQFKVFGVEQIFQPILLDQNLDIERIFEGLIPGLVASLLIVWWFMPRLISDYKGGASLKQVTGRIVTLVVCIIPISMFLGFVGIRIEEMPLGNMITTTYLVRVGILCILILPFVYKTIKASIAGKPSKGLTILVFMSTIVLDLIGPFLIIGSPFMSPLTWLLKTITHVGAGGLTILLSVMCMAVMRSIKKVS